ncbi:MAG TPA: TonB-dependent receptor [Gemmatimonadaceae bacterium]|nr:TonB-dependent receptor [Gemmatimonadaceae bacterium]
MNAHRFFALAILAAAPQTLRSQTPVSGIVITTGGRPISGANVFDIGTLEGVITGEDGRFRLMLGDSATIVARKLGFVPAQKTISRSHPDSIVIRLERAAPVLTPITVSASTYTANEERTATLTPLEVVTIPGTAADINRALQTLPGLQQVDEGTGLYVRGGDSNETKVFLNEAELLNPIEIQSPNGTFMGSVDPFLVDGIVFSSGGFGARYGDALSAVVNLQTQRRPARRGMTASLGLAGVSVSLAEPVTKQVALRFATNVFDLRPLIALNGSSHEYQPAPRGRDLSGSIILNSRNAGALTIFGISKTNRLGVAVTDPSYSGLFGVDVKADLAVATWRAERGRLKTTIAGSAGRSENQEKYGAFQLDTRLGHTQLFGEADWIASQRITLRAGAEHHEVHALFEGSIPHSEVDLAPGSRTKVLGSDGTDVRSGLFAEGDFRIGQRLRLVTGARTDESDMTRERTLDPRVSLAFRTIGSAHITAAWGIYHEIADPLLSDDVLGNERLRSMRAMHSILGFQAGDNAEMVRLELYHKRYDDLTRQTRDYEVATNGEGTAYGLDAFVKATAPLGVRTRMTYSYVDSRRTDPNTGLIADAPFDVPHSITLVAQKYIKNWEAGAAYRYATGRPFTPVSGATFNTDEKRWIPSYAPPFSERLPTLTRFDLSLSNIRQLAPGWQIVMYGSVTNVLGRHNIYRYTYSFDYTQRIPVASLFDRALYVGASILH